MLTLIQITSSMTIHCVQQSRYHVTYGSRNMIDWHVITCEYGQENTSVSDDIWNEQEHVFIHFLRVAPSLDICNKEKYEVINCSQMKTSSLERTKLIYANFNTIT